MCMKPMELNVVNQIPGNDIHLYDTTRVIDDFKPEKNEKIRFFEYGYGIINGRDLLKWAIIRMKQKMHQK